MPEMTVSVRWPDGEIKQHYSPSLVMHDHLQAGGTYTVTDFVKRSQEGLAEASERVKTAFGFYCSSATDSAAIIVAVADHFEGNDTVEVVAMNPPLPPT